MGDLCYKALWVVMLEKQIKSYINTVHLPIIGYRELKVWKILNWQSIQTSKVFAILNSNSVMPLQFQLEITMHKAILILIIQYKPRCHHKSPVQEVKESMLTNRWHVTQVHNPGNKNVSKLNALSSFCCHVRFNIFYNQIDGSFKLKTQNHIAV